MTKLPDNVTREINELVALATTVAHQAAGSSSALAGNSVEQLLSVATRGGQLIRRLYGADSQYYESWQSALGTREFSRIHSNWYRHVSEMVGILQAVAHEVNNGLLADIRGLLRAEIFADFMEMAEHLLQEGYKDASAVLLGAVLEDSLRKIAGAHNVQLVATNGKPLTIDPLNIAVAKAGAYGPLVQKQITSWANLRNDAAHGRFSEYDKDQVKQMLLFVQKFCSDFLP
jgi:hypothetical protein